MSFLFQKLFCPTVRKNCFSDCKKLWKFEVEGREFSKILRSPEQFKQGKVKKNFKTQFFLTYLFMQISQI